MRILILCLIIFVPIMTIGNDAINTKSLIGFKDIHLHDSLSLSLDKINSHGFKYENDDIENQSSFINPYIMISKRFYYNYTPSSLVLKKDGGTFYITFKGLKLQHPDYTLKPRGNDFLLQYNKLKRFDIVDTIHLKRLNPHLKSLSFYYYKDQLYQVRYTLKLNMDKLYRLHNNYKERFGLYNKEIIKDGNIRSVEKYEMKKNIISLPDSSSL